MRAIVACDRRFGIGKDNGIPFKSDLAFFKQMTMGSPIIMGRNTWRSLPKKPLEGRWNIVVSTQYPAGRYSVDKTGDPFYVVRSMFDATDMAERLASTKDAFVIGGASIYKEAIDLGLIDEIIMTRYGSIHDCDVFFPYGNELEKKFPAWKVMEQNNDVDDPYIRLSYVKESG